MLFRSIFNFSSFNANIFLFLFNLTKLQILPQLPKILNFTAIHRNSQILSNVSQFIFSPQFQFLIIKFLIFRYNLSKLHLYPDFPKIALSQLFSHFTKKFIPSKYNFNFILLAVQITIYSSNLAQITLLPLSSLNSKN